MEDQREAVLRQRDELAQEIKRRRDAEQKEALQAELAKRHLGHFLRAVWPIVEKSDRLQWGKHLDAVCLHLEAVAAGSIHNIAISLPPGCLAGDSLVPVLSGCRWRQIAIGQLAADKPLWRSDPPCVPQPDGRGNLVPVRLRDVWPSGVKEVFRLRTRTGRTIRGTADHPFMVESAVEPGGRPIFVKLGELVPGDRVCVDADGRVGWEEVTSVSSAGHEPTFDLEVADDPHCFVANGFVVSNCTKTKLIMEAFPAWLWARDPTRRILCISNSSSLAEKSSMLCRDILRSDWYRKHFPAVVIKEDQDTKTAYRTTQGGYRIAKPMMSRITGEKSDIILMDDPNDAEQVLSKAYSDNVRSWYERGLHNRVNSFIDSARVAVGQRTGQKDLIDMLVSQFGYEYLFLCEEFEPHRRFTTSIGWTDWRTEPGELLRPDRFGPDQVAIEKKRPYYRAYHQQDPSSEETAFFKRSYFEHRWRWAFPGSSQIVLPTDDPKGKDYVFDAAACVRFATIDAAASAKTSADHTACVVFCMAPNGHLVVLDCIIRQVDIPDQPLVLAEIHRKHAPPILGIERAGANASMYQFAVRMGFTCVPMEPRGRDKLTRAQAAIMRASKGEIWLPQDGIVPDFDVQDFINELVQFTGIDGNGRDDRVDCVSMSTDIMPMLSQVAIGRGARPQSVDPMRGAIRQPPGSVMVPPIGERRASVPRSGGRPGMGGPPGIPGLIKPSSRFPGR